jgi:glyoxylase-like metal-dependent hydrolase (beta-lactamase superfamily II)
VANEAASERTPRLFKRLFSDSIQPVFDAGAAVLIDGVHEIDENISMVPTPGHSPGHMRIDIQSRGDLAIHCGDIVHFPYEIPEPEIPCAVSDWDTAQAVRTRVRLLEECAERDALLLTVHLHDPAVGRISRANGSFAYTPGWTTGRASA